MSDYNKDNAKGRYIPDRDEFATQYMPGGENFIIPNRTRLMIRHSSLRSETKSETFTTVHAGKRRFYSRGDERSGVNDARRRD